jgi:hypothetical protein
LFWIKIPSSVITNFSNDAYISGVSSIIFLGIYCLYRYQRRKQKKDLLKLIDVKKYVSGKLWSPSILMKKVKDISQIYFIPELIPLISTLIARSPDVFNVEAI